MLPAHLPLILPLALTTPYGLSIRPRPVRVESALRQLLFAHRTALRRPPAAPAYRVPLHQPVRVHEDEALDVQVPLAFLATLRVHQASYCARAMPRKNLPSNALVVCTSRTCSGAVPR